MPLGFSERRIIPGHSLAGPLLYPWPMQRPLKEHVANLEEKIIVLKRELRDDSLAGFQRSEREIALSNAEEALRLFRKAYDLERRLPPVG